MNNTSVLVEEHPHREMFEPITYLQHNGSSYGSVTTVIEVGEGLTLAVVPEPTLYGSSVTTQEFSEWGPLLRTAYMPTYVSFVRWRLYDEGESITLLADLGVADFLLDLDSDYRRVVVQLRNNGRELLADEVVRMLRNGREDPDAPEIKLFSLQAMARFLAKEERFDDPIVGPDPYGIMQAEWHIIGNGLLVMAFVETDTIHCVAQSDATPEREALNKSVRLKIDTALEEFRHLVPERYALRSTEALRSVARL